MYKKKNNEAEKKGEMAFSSFVNNLAESLDPDSDKGAYLWKAQAGPQTMAFGSMADELFYGGAAGGGKVQKGSSKVITPFGSKRFDELKKGDQICNPDGTVQSVVGVYPQPINPFYRVTFIDGATVDVGKEHLWNYWYAGKNVKTEHAYLMYNPDKGIHWEYTKHKVGDTQDLYEYHVEQEKRVQDGKRPFWITIPLTKPVKYTAPVNRYDKLHIESMHPYIMGILLSKDSLNHPDEFISYSNQDEEVHERVKLFLDLSLIKNTNSLRKALNYFGLTGCLSNNKFVPKAYKYLSVENREMLMQGLMDGGGYVDGSGHLSYTTVSEQFAKDIQEVAWSLGCKANIVSEIPTYNYREEKKEEQLVYTVWIQGENLERLVYLPRKRELIRKYNDGVSEPGRRIISIEPIEDSDGICIAVDNPNGMYITDDFIVTHNSDLLIGWALTRGYRSIIYRRELKQLRHMISRSTEILQDTPASFNGQEVMWRDIPGNRVLEFGSIPHDQAIQKYQGRPFDFIGFDEITAFKESHYTYLTTWNRTAIPGARTRIIVAGNPPTNVDGEWVVRYWAPWLDPQHPNPAKPGELRWYMPDPEDNMVEYEEEPEPYWSEQLKDYVYPLSRTFIPARVSDNKYYGSNYLAKLQGLPPELKDKFLYGNFGIVFTDDPWQVIPSDFIKAGQDRWKELNNSGKIKELENVNPSYGLDPAEAGKDSNAMCKMNVNVVQWIRYNDESDLMEVSNWVVSQTIGHKFAPIAIDSIGVGAGVFYRLRQLGYRAVGIKVSSRTQLRDRTGNMQFFNLRAYLWWLMRDALDPHGDIKLAIPPDTKLERELMAPRWHLTDNGLVQVDRKEVIRERLGRSPDAANGLMMTLYVSHVRRPPVRMV